ncbi:MAG: glycosyltransferase family 9 protein [Candidatus Binataceae bacterium]|nr:glycosyltransferase family 9 protein [Candidatus Binataceae bacterium]
MASVSDQVKRVLIYRLGSLGDTVVALPCLHLIARAFPNAERRMLTNIPVNAKAPMPALVLGESGLVHSYMSYPLGLRQIAALCQLSTAIKRWQPDVLVYLAEPRSAKAIIRDVSFFRISGVKKVVGIPWRKGDRLPRPIGETGRYELEATRLARCISPLGHAAVDDPASWDLRLGANEREQVNRFLHSWPARTRFFACGVGTKVEVNDWGVEKWRRLLSLVGRGQPNVGLLLVGAREEAAVSSQAAADWQGPVLNLCGVTSPRETAGLLQEAEIYLGHDSGPMHLAAAVGTPCVAVFSARNLPGVWFPCGSGHRVIYHRVPCAGCGLERCLRYAKTCINSITVEEVYAAVSATLSEARAGNVQNSSSEASTL